MGQQEEQDRQKQAALAAEVEKAGFDTKKMPKKELETGEGPMFWYIRKLKLWRENGKDSMANKHEELRKRILAWRDAAAQRLRIAPADVLSEHVIVNMTYVKPTTLDALKGIGVRIVGAEELAALVTQAKSELFPDALEEAAGGASQDAAGAKRGAALQLPEGVWTPPKKWKGAVYKPGKGGAKPPWEVSYEKFSKGDMLQTIAMNQPSGKPVQASTVQGHVLTALTHGRPCDLQRLMKESKFGPVTEEEWTKMEEAFAERGADVDAEDTKTKDILCGILGEKVNREPATKSDADRAEEQKWYDRLRFFLALKRTGFASAKRQRVA